MRFLFGALVTIALGLVAIECHEGAGWLSSRIVLLAVKLLPERLRVICHDEWLAELEAFEGLRLVKLFLSVGFYVAGIKLRFRYRSEIKAERGRDDLIDPASPDFSFVLRRHPGTLILAVWYVLTMLVVAIGASVSGPPKVPIRDIWSLWGFCGITLLYLLWSTANWAVNYFAVSPSEFVWQWGLIRRRAARIPVANMQSIQMRRSLFGRIFGYGTLIIDTQYPCTPCRSCTHRRIVPYPHQVMLELGELLEASPTPFVIAD